MDNGFNVIFMGTPEFSVPTLNVLHKSHHNVVLVVTQPDRPKGRGRKLTPPPVKLTASELGYEVIQPDTLRTDFISDQLKMYQPDVFVVVAFGHILTGKLLNIPKYGAINIHASLLPKYRGVSPIQWAIINGEKETGITTIQMDTGTDTGDILLSQKIPIGANDTASSLHDRLADLGADVLMKTLDLLEVKKIKPIPQDHSLFTYAPKLQKKDGHIDWSMPAEKIERWIRAMIPWPGAFTFHREKRLKIFSSSVKPVDIDDPPGVVIESDSNELLVSTGKHLLSIVEIQSASGKKLTAKDFLQGNKIQPGDILT